MEDVYTIKVKTKPDTRNVFPSERRYSASTVSGLAWVHIALAATSFLLACLALLNPNTEAIEKVNLNDTQQRPIDRDELIYNLTLEVTTEWISEENVTETATSSEYGVEINYVLVLAPTLLTVFALAAGLAAIMASVRWYIDKNITWLFIMSILSTMCSFVAFVLIASWFVQTSSGTESFSEFYKDKIPFKDYIVVKHSDVIDKNESHLVLSLNNNSVETTPHSFTKRVLSINILIAAFLEFLWSILSIRISYRGMRSNYKDEGADSRRGNCVSVVTKIKGNNAKKYPKNGKLVPPKPDLIEHYPNKKIKRIFLANGEDGFYLKKQNDNGQCNKNTETSSEYYKERMINFLNRCASLDGVSNPEITPSVHSEPTLNTIPEATNVEINVTQSQNDLTKVCATPISWGDSPEHTIYNQNNINFDSIFKFGGREKQNGRGDCAEAMECDVQPIGEASEKLNS